MRTLVVRTIAAMVLATVVATPVQASCVELAEPAVAVREADVAFVGTVVRLANQDRWATVAVEEVWRGPDLGPTVEVRGGPAGNVATSVDRTYRLGRYLFVVSAAGGHFSDSACSATTEWDRTLEPIRPADARRPLGASVGDEPSPSGDTRSLAAPLIVASAAGLALMAVVSVLALRRRQR